MSPNAYTEDQLVEQPAIGLFAALGWQTASALDESFGPAGALGRETKGEVVLVSRLRAALERLNPALPPEAITAAVDELTRDRLTLQRLAERAAHPHPASPILRTRCPPPFPGNLHILSQPLLSRRHRRKLE